MRQKTHTQHGLGLKDVYDGRCEQCLWHAVSCQLRYLQLKRTIRVLESQLAETSQGVLSRQLLSSTPLQ